MRYLTKILVLTVCLIALSGVAAACDCGTNECKTPGYWKNHPEAWPKEYAIGITIGEEYYDKCAAIEIMKQPVKGDKTYNMFDALVAAKLNVAAGCSPCKIAHTIIDADQWMDKYSTIDVKGSTTGVKANSSAWQDRTYFTTKCSVPSGEYLFQKLDAYNNGLL